MKMIFFPAFFNTGEYSQGEVTATISPSMDIQVASNFERFLYYMLNEDGTAVSESMNTFKINKKLTLSDEARKKSQEYFSADKGNTTETLNIIKRYKHEHNYLLDPHSAVGVHVGEQHLSGDSPLICLATAHPAKFPRALLNATGEISEHEILNGTKRRQNKMC